MSSKYLLITPSIIFLETSEKIQFNEDDSKNHDHLRNIIKNEGPKKGPSMGPKGSHMWLKSTIPPQELE